MNLQRPLQVKTTPKQEKTTTEHDSQIRQYMKKQIERLTQQNFDLKGKCRNFNSLEQKVHIWQKQNEHLLKQNEKMSKYLSQLRVQNQQLKQKYEVMYQHKIKQLQENNRTKTKQIQMLQDKITQEYTFKSTSLDEIKIQYQLEIKHLKKKAVNSQQNYQIEIRRLRQQLQKRSSQLMENANKLKRVNIQSEYQMVKLKEEKEKLKNQLTFGQHDKIKELEDLRLRLEENYANEMEQLKRVYLAGEQQLRAQSSKLKQQLQQKTQELQSIIIKNNRQKNYYQDSLSYLKKDCQNYRIRLIQTQRLYNLQILELKQQLSTIHLAQIQEIRYRLQLQIKSKEEEITRLESVINGKNDEIQVLIKDKVALRNNYDNEIMKIKEDYRVVLENFEELTIRSTEEINQSSKRLVEKDKQILHLSDLLKNIRNNHESQKSNYRTEIQALKEKIRKQKQEYCSKEEVFRAEIVKLRNQLDSMKKQYDQKVSKLQITIKKLEDQLNGTSIDLTDKVANLNSQYTKLLAQNQKLKKLLAQKDETISRIKARLIKSEEIEAYLQAQIVKLKQRGIARQKLTAENLEKFKKSLEDSYSAQSERIKKHYEALLVVKNQEIETLINKLSKKQAQFSKILQDYEMFMRQAKDIVQQQANKKEIDIKFAGATGKLVRIKNTFDMFLKMKVIKVCDLSTITQ